MSASGDALAHPGAPEPGDREEESEADEGDDPLFSEP